MPWDMSPCGDVFIVFVSVYAGVGCRGGVRDATRRTEQRNPLNVLESHPRRVCWSFESRRRVVSCQVVFMRASHRAYVQAVCLLEGTHIVNQDMLENGEREDASSLSSWGALSTREGRVIRPRRAGAVVIDGRGVLWGGRRGRDSL